MSMNEAGSLMPIPATASPIDMYVLKSPASKT